MALKIISLGVACFIVIEQVENYSTFGASMFTLLMTILGEFDYEEIQEVDDILAPIYFVSFIFLVFFVLLVHFVV